MTDTTREAEGVRMGALRAMTPTKRLSMALGWSQSLRDLTMSELRLQFPAGTADELRRLMAERTLGAELASKAYGTPKLHG